MEMEAGSAIPYEEFESILYENLDIFTPNLRNPDARWIFPGKHVYKFSYQVDIIIIIIIITRPKPAYGRQGLTGSWGQDTDKVSNFWVFLTSHFAQLGIKPTWDHS